MKAKYHTRETIALDVIAYGSASIGDDGERMCPVDENLCRPEAYRVTKERIAELLTDDPLQLFREMGCLDQSTTAQS